MLETKKKKIAANKILKKYKNMKKPKKTYLVNEKDLETIDYSEPEDLFQRERESILNVANKVLDFNEFKEKQLIEIKYQKKKTTDRQSGTNSSKKNIKKIQKHQISLMEDNKKE